MFFSLSILKTPNELPKVYFTKTISSEELVRIYKLLDHKLEGKIALKVHSGEIGNPYHLKPSFLRSLYELTQGTYVECNAAYEGARHKTSIHEFLLLEHGWKRNGNNLIIMDADPNKDIEVKVNNHSKIEKNYLGEKIQDFDSCVVLSHFKGHMMGGFGGAMKQLSIGFGSQKGKTYQHTAGKTTKWEEMDDNLASQLDFTSSMADAASTVVDYFKSKNKGGIIYINVLKDISSSCDCDNDPPVPKISNLGMMISLDPIAIDQACLDYIQKHGEKQGVEELFDQITKLEGLNTLKVGEENHKLGSRQYEFIDVTESSSSSIPSSSSSKTSSSSSSIKTNGIIILSLLFLLF